MDTLSGSLLQRASQIVFFDLETTVPNRAVQRFWILEFGAIVVCPRKLVELESYSTIIRPKDLSAVALKSGRCDGITREAVANASAFEEIADKIYSILNGRIWAGHNIQRFDCVRIKEVFAEIGEAAPVPIGMTDSLGVLNEKFGRRAGNLKMATLATYFGHLLWPWTTEAQESSLPTLLHGKWKNSPTVTSCSRSNGKLPCREESSHNLLHRLLLLHTKEQFLMQEQVGEVVKNLLCKAQETKSIKKLLKHSHSLLR